SFTFLPLRCTKKSGRNPLFYVEYDQNGNLTSDANKNITSIEYNYINQPTKITVGGTNSGTIDYVYAADGTKLKKTTSTGLEVDYAGGYVYNNDVLQFFPHPEGYVSVDNGSYQYVYNYSDHLGNIRLSYTDADGNGSIDPANEIVEENNYYPMGMKHKGYNEVISSLGNSIAKKWKFQGVEFEEALDIDLYEMEFRNYDPAIGRFSSIDPMAEQRNWLTPYNFVQNNPIVRVDPSGLLDDYGIDQNGNVTLIEETDDKFDRLYSVTSDENGELVKNENGEVVKNDTNGDGKVNNRDSSGKIRDRSVLPELAEVKETSQDSYHGEKNLRDATRGEGSQSDLFKVFNFAANNSNVEWSLYRLNIDGETQFNVGSYGNRTLSPGGSRFDQSQLVAGIHSHPNIPSTNAEEIGSMFGDRSQTLGQIRRNGQAAGLKYVYFPNSNNIYNINNTNGNTSYIRNTGGDYRRFFFGTLNSQ
uniref:RHS repeat-associated core domain-containing protein n=1 Tax=Flagellimonas sp. 389 TaxID=2835862 RepID=UPI001DFF980C